MKTPLRLVAPVALALLLFGCGTDESRDSPAQGLNLWGGYDLTTPFEGLWTMQSLTVDDDGTPFTLTRDRAPWEDNQFYFGLLGNAWFEARSADTARIYARQAYTVDGFLMGPVDFHIVDVEVSAIASPLETLQQWILRDELGHTDVYTVTRDGDVLTLVYDETSPYNKSYSPALRIVLSKTEPFGDQAIGLWDLTSMTQQGQTMDGDACVELGPTQWAMLHMQISIDRWGLFENQMTIEGYSDDTCTNANGLFDQTSQIGYVEEIAAPDVHARTTLPDAPSAAVFNHLRTWVLQDDGTSQYLTFEIRRDGDDLALNRIDCLRAPECLDKTPSQVLLHAAAK